MAIHSLASTRSLLDATVAGDASAATALESDPHWHMPADGCDHRSYACRDCCPHGDGAD